MQLASPLTEVAPSTPATLRRWVLDEVLALYDMPLMDLLWRAQGVHRAHFDPNAVQRSSLLSVKTGGVRRIVVIARSQRVTTRIPSASV